VSAGEGSAPSPFVVGVPRSGTTLLRLMLDAHPELTIPPETHFIPSVIRALRRGGSADRVADRITQHRRWADFGLDAGELRERIRALDPLEAGPAIRAFYELYAERQAKPRWGDKTPGYATKMRRIAKALPEARFVHVIRDGRDVVASQARRARRQLPVDVAARRWKRRVISTRNRAKGVDHYAEVRYEELVGDTEATLRRVCALVELPFDEAMLSYHEQATERLAEIDRDLPARRGRRDLGAEPRIAAHARADQPPDPRRIGAWRDEMAAEDVAAFEAEAGDLLDALGYARQGRLAS
jgi:Sulfotransferase family